jgi:heterodisulfide reductase subunit D
VGRGYFDERKKPVGMETKQRKVEVPVMADMMAKGEKPEYLVWIGSAGAFDDRYKQVPGLCEGIGLPGDLLCGAWNGRISSGDVARRAGNEMLFQMQALMNIEIFEGYEVKKILTCDPHAYNTFKNEYPDLGGNYEVIHHSQFLRDCFRYKREKIRVPAAREGP